VLRHLVSAPLRETDLCLAEIRTPQIKHGYVLLGDEAFLQRRARLGVLAELAPPESRDFSLHDLDLAETGIFDVLDLAQTPSLMAPFQVIFVRNLKLLYGRAAKKPEFEALAAYFRRPNPAAVLLFVADHIHLPVDLRRIEMTDKERADRIRETLGEWCPVVELAQVSEEDAVHWVTGECLGRGLQIDADAARELVDALAADMLLLGSELDKLCLYVQGKRLLLAQDEAVAVTQRAPGMASPRPTITLADVETMVLAAKQRSLYELTDAISRHDLPGALALLHGLLNSSDGGEDSAIGHLFMLAKTFRQMLILNEKQVRDSRAVWQVLWPGFRMPPFAADDLVRQARRYKSPAALASALRHIANADREIRSSPPDKRLVLERLVLALASERPAGAATLS
jgi:DNA polymerase-3 subunit delta